MRSEISAITKSITLTFVYAQITTTLIGALLFLYSVIFNTNLSGGVILLVMVAPALLLGIIMLSLAFVVVALMVFNKITG